MIPLDPVDVVQAQLEAYNVRDLARFLATYSDSVMVYRPPAREPSISGKTELSCFYAEHRFNLPALKADIVTHCAGHQGHRSRVDLGRARAGV